MLRLVTVISLVSILCIGQQKTAEPSTQVYAGAAEIDITPDYPVRLNGFGGRRTESEGVRQRIFARALVIGQLNNWHVLLAIDNLTAIHRTMAIGMDDGKYLVPDWVNSLNVTASHTHTAPMLHGMCPTIFGLPIPNEHEKNIERYTAELAKKVGYVIGAAVNARKPATVEYALGSVPFAANRRTKGGPVDHDLPLLAVKSAKDGKLIALWTSYACHAVTLRDNKISGDWPGYAAEQVQRRHPGSICLLSIGCGADSNPSTTVVGAQEDAARDQGAQVADEVDRLLKTPMRPITASLTVKEANITLPLAKLPTKEEWEERAKRRDAIGFHARYMLEKLAKGETLTTEIKYPICTWTFGDQLAMVFLPGEVVVDYSHRLKDELDRSRLWINAYSNDSPGYVPSERILKEGGYEGGGAMTYYGIPGPYAPGLENKIVATVEGLLGPAYRSPVDSTKLGNTRPLSPQQSLATLQTHPDLEIELVAAEPLITSPVAIDWSLDGKLYVCEMCDYPSGIPGVEGPGGRVRVLTKSKPDGPYDRSEIFLDKIPFPTGITSYRKGLLVCAAPDILYAEDTKGAGKADVVKKLYSGFGTHNFQARVNSLEYGLDGWIYGSCGLFGGSILSHKTGKTYPLGDRDFRIKLETGEIEAVQGRTQQGRTRDDWGNWFGCDNSNLAFHYPLEEQYLRRNPYLKPPPAAVLIPEVNKVYPRSKNLLLHERTGPPGLVTSACGLGAYRDNLLGSAYQNNLFVCEPVNLLVHRMILEPKQSTFVGKRATNEQQSEFLTSTDPWFRAVQAKTGPDGALYIVDMHRFVIEHPQWIPFDERQKLDLRAGSTMGRIFRVKPKGKELRPIPRLDQMKPAELVAALDTPNGWVRDRIVDRISIADGPHAKDLRTLLLGDGAIEGRCSALLALVLGHELGPTDYLPFEVALKGPWQLRLQALRVGNPHQTHWARFGKPLSEFSAQERLAIAYSAAGHTHERLLKGNERWNAESYFPLLDAYGDDPYLCAALDSDLNWHLIWSRLSAHIETFGKKEPSTVRLAAARRLLRYALRDSTAAPPADFSTRLLARDAAVWRSALLEDIQAELRKQNYPLASFFGDTGLRQFNEFMNAARSATTQSVSSERDRLAALSCLGYDAAHRKDDLTLAEKLLAPQTPAAIQQGALALLARTDDNAVPIIIARVWAALTPSLRNEALDLLLSKPAWQKALVDEVEKGAIQASQFDASRRQRLVQSTSGELRSRAEKLFAGASRPDRAKLLDEYQDVLKLSSDRVHGRAVFTQRCSVCHKLGDVGHAVGPDLAGVVNKSPGYLLQEILDPNRQVDSRYFEYVALLKNGKLATGILASESSHSITLRAQEGKEQVLLRGDIDELKSSNKSLMPEGLEKDLSKQDLADVIAYVRDLEPTPKYFKGNRPEVVKAQTVVYSLLATNAEIHGPTLVYEFPLRNLGMWGSLNDHAAWKVEIEKAGRFDVYLDWACDSGSAGNTWLLEGGKEPLSGAVASTGGWDRFRRTKAGTIELAGGLQNLSIRAAGDKINGALFDLRAVHLIPQGAEAKIELALPGK